MRYIFNPEHDYALANNDANFMAPKSALKFASDCAGFMQIFENESDQRGNIPEPWGWDKAVKKRLHNEGTPDSLLPSDETLDYIRKLAHRRIVAEWGSLILSDNAIRKFSTYFLHLNPAKELTTMQAVSEYIQHSTRDGHSIVIKSPYSGNGKGIINIRGNPSATQITQITSVLKKQESLLAEYEYRVIQDFAMEFKCKEGFTEWCGYSLFNTRNFSYTYNYLLSDNAIKRYLEKWIKSIVLDIIKQKLTEFINYKIAPFYNGFLGVDMFVYEEDGLFCINPAVEINLRYTMGIAARLLFDRRVDSNSHGTMQVLHFNQPGVLEEYIKEQSIKQPLISAEGRWIEGFKTLTDVKYESEYAIAATIVPDRDLIIS